MILLSWCSENSDSDIELYQNSVNLWWARLLHYIAYFTALHALVSWLVVNAICCCCSLRYSDFFTTIALQFSVTWWGGTTDKAMMFRATVAGSLQQTCKTKTVDFFVLFQVCRHKRRRSKVPSGLAASLNAPEEKCCGLQSHREPAA